MKENKEEVWYSEVSPHVEKTVKYYVDYDSLKKKKNLNILDFGCGNGRYMRLLKKLFPKATIYGVDINKENVKKIKEEFPNTHVLNQNKMDLRFKKNFFDLVFSSNVIEHIERELYLEYIAEINKIMKKDSRFVFGTPNYPIKRFYDLLKFARCFVNLNFTHAKYYLFDDPTHINKLNYNILEKDFKIFKRVELYPTFNLFAFTKNKKLSDKIMGIAFK